MKLKVGEHNYKIWFEYKHGPAMNERGQIYNHQVNCHIMREQEVIDSNGVFTEDKPYVSGFSLCKVPDKFVKETGRKKALTSALRRTSFDRDERRQFWEAYHRRGLDSQAREDLVRLKKGRAI